MRYQLRTASGALVGTILVCALVLAIVGGERIKRDRFPSGWDEAQYINHVCTERFMLTQEGVLRFAKSLITLSKNIPPGYRMAAVPLFVIAKPTPALLKTFAFISFILSAVILFFAGRQIASAEAGLVWASAFSFSVGPYITASYFGTETTLYPAVAGCLYAVARWFRKERPDASTLVALALSTGVGALSKTSFFVILIPLIGMAMLLAPSKNRGSRSWLPILASVGCGILVAAPWWVFNWKNALEYARYASAYYRNDFPWATQAAINLFGVPFMISFLVFSVWALSQARAFWKTHDRMYSSFLLVCLVGFLPLVVLHIAGSNHNMRLITPALIPLTGIVAVLLHLTNLLRRWIFAILTIPLFVTQTLVVAWISIHNTQDDQWDWDRLRELALTYKLSGPTIVHLGNGPAFNPAQIEYPWACHGETVSEQWAWRFEEGPLDWRKVEAQIDRANIVLTIPGFVGDLLDKNDLDNVHNEELARRLFDRPDIWKFVSVNVDTSGKEKVMVFLRKSRLNF